jgi:hypothetical protein
MSEDLVVLRLSGRGERFGCFGDWQYTLLIAAASDGCFRATS